MKKWDFILIIGLLLISCLAFVFFMVQRSDGTRVRITIDGGEYLSLPLDTDKTIRIPETGEHYNIVEIKAGSVTVSEADCPDKTCVNHHAISKTGETIICLPHKLSILIDDSNSSTNEIDGTAY